MNVRGNKCSFINCGKSRRDFSNLQQYKFPKDNFTSRKWIINSGNVKLLDLSPNSLNKRVVCMNHFNDSDFENAVTKKRLKRGAIPKSYDLLVIDSTKLSAEHQCETLPNLSLLSSNESPEHLKVLKPVNTYGSLLSFREIPSTSRVRQTPSPTISSDVSPNSKVFINSIVEMPEVESIKKNQNLETTPRKKKLKSTIIHQRNLLKNKRSLIARLRKNREEQKRQFNFQYIIGNATYKSKYSRTLTLMQTLHGNNKKWTKDEKDFALQLFYKSPTAYKYMRNKLQIVLPSISCIRRWVGDSKCKTGFSQKLFDQLKKKVAVMDEAEKHCTIVFDEMKIKKCLEYNKLLDLIEGYEDLGPTFGRSKVFGTQVMVFLARGIYAKWKMPLGYFVVATSMNHNILEETLSEVIKKTIESGLIVRAVVCDQGQNNQSAVKGLGITTEKPYFSISDRKVFVIFDILHIFKNFRTHFIKNDFMFKDKKISFNDIRKTLEIDLRSRTGRTLLKITESHVNPNAFEKMSCRLALQIFSKTVAAGIRTVVGTGELVSETSLDTADFIDFMNNLFDTMNSKFIYSKNPFGCAISEDKPLIMHTILNARESLRNLKKITPKGLSSPDCFNGMLITLTSVIGLYKEQKQMGFKYLLTNRLNQDVIENTFSSIRNKGGFNPNPTVRTFRCTFRMIMKMNIMKASELSNCEDDDDINLMTVEANIATNDHTEIVPTPSNLSSQTSTSGSRNSSNSSIDISENSEYEVESITLEDCSNTYFAGYLAKKCIDKFQCEHCEENLILKGDEMTDNSQLLIINKMYKTDRPLLVGLKKPTKLLVEIVRTSLLILRKFIDKTPHRSNLRKILSKHIYKQINRQLLLLHDNCDQHIQFLVNHLIYCKLFKECKWKTFNEKETLSRKRKLAILKGS